MRISKKILAAVLAALMAISMMPFTALAADAVAEVNGTSYETFEDALAAISTVTTAKHSNAVDPNYDYKTYVANGNITLLANCTSNGIIIGSGSNLVVDLNGHTLDINAKPVGSNGTESIALQLLKGSSIYFDNGTLTSSYTYASTNKEHIQRLIQNYANLTFDNVDVTFKGNFKNQATISHCNGELVLKGGSTLAAPDFSRLNYSVESAATNLGAIAAFVGTFSTYTDASANVDGGSAITGNVKVQVLNPETAVSNTLTLTSGSINGDIVIGNNADKVEVSKAETFTQAAPEGYEWVAGETAGTQKLVKDTHSVAKVNGTKYDSLADAIAAANAGDTITLISDTTLATTDIIINKNLTIDFGTYTVTAARWPFINKANLTLEGTTGGLVSSRGLIDNYGTLTVNGGVYNNTAIPNPAIWNNPGGTVVINGGTIDSNNADVYNEAGTVTINGGVLNSASSSKVSSDAYCYAVRNLPGSSCTMNGGTINAVHGGIAAYGDGVNTTTVVINDGTITTHNSELGNDAFYPIYVSGNDTSVTVKGGTFSGPRAAAMIDDDDIGLTENTALTITGGNFTSPSGVAAVTCGQNESIPVISGGTFSSDVTAYLVEGYTQNMTTGEVIPDNDVDTMSITVEESVDLNIYVADPADEIETVEFTYNSTPNKEVETPVTKTVPATKNADGKIALKVDLAPAQIKDTIKVVAKNANGEAVKTIDTSVADYCKAIINGNFDSNLKDLAKATLDYGKAAANYFSYNASAYTDANYLDAPTFNASDYEQNATDLPINSVSYVATSVPELRFYINTNTGYFNESNAEYMNTRIKSNIGTARFVKLEGTNQIILQIKNIPITDFGKQIIVAIDNGNEDTPILKYTPIKWVIAAQSLGGDLGTLADGIGNYYAKSAAYFEA